MTIDDKIRNRKLQYNFNRTAAKISALSSGKTGRYEYLTVEEILPLQQHKIIQEAKFSYLPLGKAFAKQAKSIKEQGKEQVKTLKSLDLNNQQIQSF